MDGGGNVSGQGRYTPYGGTVGTELDTPYAWQGQSGLSHEREGGFYQSGASSTPPYVPGAPTYASPQSFSSPNPYQPMNANPASYGPQDEGDDDPFPVDENGRALPYQPMRRGLHQLAGGMKNALNFAAGFNPIYQLGEIGIGQNAAGECVPASQRILGAAMMAVPFMHNINLLNGIRIPLKNYGKIASAVTGKFGNLECVECADAVVRALKKARVNGEIIEIQGGGDFIVSKTYGDSEAISRNGRHIGVQVGDTVFDNIHKTGIPFTDWLKDFNAIGGITIVKRTRF